MSAVPPDHEILGVLREVPGQRRVLQTRVAGLHCVTRILLVERIHPNQESLIRQIALHGRGSLTGIPEAVALTLEGYRVAARLDEGARRGTDGTPLWPKATAAGLTADLQVFVSTTWMPGTPLHEVVAELAAAEREAIALDVLGILVRLHSAHVAWGDLKTENIVVGVGRRASLIDLDTLREVPDEHTAAVTRDLTRAWAAPEQERHQQTFLASDVWAWAHLVERLWFGAPPETWRPLLGACRHEDPLRRPHTAELLAALQPETPGGPARVPPSIEAVRDWRDRPLAAQSPAESTERVPEAAAGVDSTERVPEGPGPSSPASAPRPAAPTPAAAPTRAAPLPRAEPVAGCLQIVFVMVAIATVLCMGAATWSFFANVASNSERVSALEAAMKAYKTEPALNNNAQQSALAGLAEPSFLQYTSPRWEALAGLARVWATEWQNTGHRWDDTDKALADSVVSELAHNDEPEAHLALASAQAALCRHTGDLATAAHCESALAETSRFFETVPDEPAWDWIRVEAVWTEVLVRSKLADGASANHLPAEDVHTQAAAGLARCEAALPWLARAPVNGPELLQDCLVLARFKQDFIAYGRYAQLLIVADLPPLDDSTLTHLYTAAGPACTSAKADKRKSGDWVVKAPPWCLAVGLYARGCADESLDVIARNEGLDPTEPWASLRSALATPPSFPTCAR